MGVDTELMLHAIRNYSCDLVMGQAVSPPLSFLAAQWTSTVEIILVWQCLPLGNL
jgi:EAL domain-containing protein (putative c-di-GMP-specific phosphodiesterase class I)